MCFSPSHQGGGGGVSSGLERSRRLRGGHRQKPEWAVILAPSPQAKPHGGREIDAQTAEEHWGLLF